MTRPPHEWNSTDIALYSMGKMDMTDERYGNRKVSKMRAEWNKLRQLVRERGDPETQAALDAVEEHIDYAYRPAAFRPDEIIPREAQVRFMTEAAKRRDERIKRWTDAERRADAITDRG